jgi:hypothetical protein
MDKQSDIKSNPLMRDNYVNNVIQKAAKTFNY